MTNNQVPNGSSSSWEKWLLFLGEVSALVGVVAALLESRSKFWMTVASIAIVALLAFCLWLWQTNRRIHAFASLLTALALFSIAQHLISKSMKASEQTNERGGFANVMLTHKGAPTAVATVPMPSPTITPVAAEPNGTFAAPRQIECQVVVDELNLRSEPTLKHNSIIGSLLRGTKVEKLWERPSADGGVWLFVKVMTGRHNGESSWIKGGERYVVCAS